MASPRREMKKSRERQARAARLAAQRRQRMMKTTVVLLVLALVIGAAGAGITTLTSSDDSDSTTTTTDGTTSTTFASLGGKDIKGDTPCPNPDGSAERANTFEKPPSLCIDPAKKYTATFDTSEGQVVVALDTTKTPNTANNFIVLARYHYYDGTTIFRTDPSIDIIQGGSPHTGDNSDPGPGYTIQDEGSGYQYQAGDLVMARTSEPNSASAQFFFATGPNVANLNSQGTYVTFGKTATGLDVLQKIIGLNQDSGSSLGGAPSRTVTVNKVTITEG